VAAGAIAVSVVARAVTMRALRMGVSSGDGDGDRVPVAIGNIGEFLPSRNLVGPWADRTGLSRITRHGATAGDRGSPGVAGVTDLNAS
jgi:hypothetical protein